MHSELEIKLLRYLQINPKMLLDSYEKYWSFNYFYVREVFIVKDKFYCYIETMAGMPPACSPYFDIPTEFYNYLREKKIERILNVQSR